MSKRSRNAHRQFKKEGYKKLIIQYINMVPSTCKGKTLIQIISDYCTVFNKEHLFTTIKSAYTLQELQSIIHI